MGQLTITLSDDQEQKVRQHVYKYGYSSVSDFVREELSKTTSGNPSFWERAVLTNLLEIKQILGVEVNEELIDALRDGYPFHYSFVEYHVTKNELSDEAMAFVRQVLEMFASLQYSYNELGIKDKKIEKDVLFEGFDGNSDNGHLGYLQFLVKHGHYSYVKPLNKGHAINSHSHVTPIYQRMLAEYKRINREGFDRRPLTLEEIKRVIDARIHPENRS